MLLPAMPLWAANEVVPEEPQIWVLPYALMILFFSLAVAILLRPTKRSDSAFSYDEQQAMKEEKLRKLKGH